jgi:hypothetical protein
MEGTEGCRARVLVWAQHVGNVEGTEGCKARLPYAAWAQQARNAEGTEGNKAFTLRRRSRECGRN